MIRPPLPEHGSIWVRNSHSRRGERVRVIRTYSNGAMPVVVYYWMMRSEYCERPFAWFLSRFSSPDNYEMDRQFRNNEAAR